MTERAHSSIPFLSNFVLLPIMNSNDKVLEVLLKISQSLDEIKTHMKSSSPNIAIDPKKIEETEKEVEMGILS